MGVSNGIGAVVAFFVLSGFVLARSLENNPNSVRYFRNPMQPAEAVDDELVGQAIKA